MERFDDHEVVRELGQGGFGTVVEATNAAGKRVALKILHDHLVSDTTVVQRFFQEALILAKLKHACIPEVHHFGPSEGTYYLSQEFVEGEPLGQLLKEAPLSVSQTVGVMGQLLDALSYAHKNEIIHRDLKPDNLILTPEGKIKILDFGIAKIIGGVSLTAPGMVNVTLGYAAPEQLRGEALDQRADIFAAGMLMHELLTSALPFRTSEKDPLERYTRQLMWTGSPRPPMRDKYPGIPQWLDEIYMRMTAPTPAERFPDAEAARQQLLAFGDGEPLTPRIKRGPRGQPTQSEIEAAPRTELMDPLGEADTVAMKAPPSPHAALPGPDLYDAATAALVVNKGHAGATAPLAAIDGADPGATPSKSHAQLRVALMMAVLTAILAAVAYKLLF